MSFQWPQHPLICCNIQRFIAVNPAPKQGPE